MTTRLRKQAERVREREQERKQEREEEREEEEEEEGRSRLGLGEGLPASTGGVLSGFCPGSEGTEKGGEEAEGRRRRCRDVQHLDSYRIV